MGTLKKQTAVEWLIEEIKKLNINYPIQKGKTPPKLLLTFAFEKAKAIEREQLFEAWQNGTDIYYESAAQFFNETYGGDK
jgi:hypothetical protein